MSLPTGVMLGGSAYTRFLSSWGFSIECPGRQFQKTGNHVLRNNAPCSWFCLGEVAYYKSKREELYTHPRFILKCIK